MPESEIAIQCNGVSVDYRADSGTVRALHDVTASMYEHRLTVIGGPSGSGKSTLLRVLAGLHTTTTGQVVVGTNELSTMTRRSRRNYRRYGIGVVLQDPSDNLFAYLTATEQLNIAARLRNADAADTTTLLTNLGLANMAERHPAELSGGEQQRLAFAIAAIGRPAVILADEPTAELDRTSATQLIATMRTLVAGGSTLVVTSHDQSVIDASDDTITIRDGRVTGDATSDLGRALS